MFVCLTSITFYIMSPAEQNVFNVKCTKANESMTSDEEYELVIEENQQDFEESTSSVPPSPTATNDNTSTQSNFSTLKRCPISDEDEDDEPEVSRKKRLDRVRRRLFQDDVLLSEDE